MSAIPPCVSTQTPKRGTAMQKCIHEHSLGSCRACPKHFAGAKVVYFFDIRKKLMHFFAFSRIIDTKKNGPKSVLNLYCEYSLGGESSAVYDYISPDQP